MSNIPNFPGFVTSTPMENRIKVEIFQRSAKNCEINEIAEIQRDVKRFRAVTVKIKNVTNRYHILFNDVD